MKRRTISFQILIRICLILLLLMAVNIGWDIYRENYFARQEMLEKARLIAGQFVATRTFIAARPTDGGEPAPLQRGSFRHLQPRSVDATLNKVFGGQNRVELREIWTEATTPVNRPEKLESSLLDELAANPEREEVFTTGDFRGEQTFIYMVPLAIEEDCLACHGSSSDSNGADPDLTLAPRHQLGDVVGGVGIYIPMDVIRNKLRNLTLSNLLLTSVLLGFVVFAVFRTVRQFVSQPLDQLAAASVKMAEGDLSAGAVFDDRGVPAEVADLGQKFQRMALNLQRLYANLEEKVQERTLALSRANEALREQQDELQQANVELQKANRLKSEFIGRASHELKTPLTSVIAFAELLMEQHSGTLNDIQLDYLRGIHEAGRTLLNSIDGLLTLSRMEAGMTQVNLTNIRPGVFIPQVVAQFSPQALRKRINLVHDLPFDLPPISIDREKLRGILHNLVDNALKYTPHGEQVTVRARYNRDKQEHLIEVEDTGMGIPPEDLEHIFEPFWRGSYSGPPEHRGTGLGLSITKYWVELHGGRIEVESRVGEGTTFRVILPRNTQGDIK